jgi:hypothetical protein
MRAALEQAGRWANEALPWREHLVSEFVASGMEKPDAQREAYVKLREHYLGKDLSSVEPPVYEVRPAATKPAPGPDDVAESPRKSPGISLSNSNASRKIRALLDAAKGKSALLPLVVEWVTENLLIPWSDIDPETVPSPAAVTRLWHAKDNDGDFFKLYDAKLLPSRSRFESDARFHNDGRDVIELSERILQGIEGDDEIRVNLSPIPEGMIVRPANGRGI